MIASRLVVFMMTYNNGDTIEDVLLDLLNQSYKEFDFYVFDDGSSDNTKDLLERYSSNFKNLSVKYNSKNLGVLKNLRLSMESIESKINQSQYFHWACPDDRYDRSYFECLMDLLDKNPEGSSAQSLVKVAFVNSGLEKIAKLSSLTSVDDSSKIFQDNYNGVYQPYNQFIHGVIRSKFVPFIFQLKGPYFLFKSLMLSELFFVALLKFKGSLVVYNDVLHTKNISASFEIRHPEDPFTLSRMSLINLFRDSISLPLFAKDDLSLLANREFYVSLWWSFKIYFWNKFKLKVKAQLRGLA